MNLFKLQSLLTNYPNPQVGRSYAQISSALSIKIRAKEETEKQIQNNLDPEHKPRTNFHPMLMDKFEGISRKPNKQK